MPSFTLMITCKTGYVFAVIGHAWTNPGDKTKNHQNKEKKINKERMRRVRE